MSFKLFILSASLLALAGCVSAPYSPDTGYSQGYSGYYAAPQPAPTTYYYYSYSPDGYVAATPGPTPMSICTDTPAGC